MATHMCCYPGCMAIQHMPLADAYIDMHTYSKPQNQLAMCFAYDWLAKSG